MESTEPVEIFKREALRVWQQKKPGNRVDGYGDQSKRGSFFS
jgi:hypothetical protein